MRARATATHAAPRPGDRRRAQAELLERLRERLPEIEQAILTRVYSVSDPADVGDPTYVAGLRAAVSSALDYAIAGIEAGDPEPGPIPPELLAQARQAARGGVSLDTVLRRYLAGHTLLGDFLIQEAEATDLLHAELQRLLRVQATLLDRLLTTVGEAYGLELESRSYSSEQRRAERVKKLLDGELLDTPELQYDFDAHHLGAIAKGPGVEEAICELAKALDRRLLLIHPGEGAVWAWLGAGHTLEEEEIELLLSQSWPAQVTVALGEPGRGLAGWRLTHRQALAALPVAQHGPEAVVRYGEVALLAAILQDDLLVTSLRALYLAPLEHERDAGETARLTLRAYFAAERQVSSAAIALGINRNTVASRLRAIEDLLDRPLASCAAELEAALRLDEMSTKAIPPAFQATR